MEEELVLSGHTGIVASVHATADGAHVLSGSWDRTVCVWRRSDGRHLRTLKGHTTCVRSVHTTGAHIVSGSDDKTVRVWRLSDGQPLRTLCG